MFLYFKMMNSTVKLVFDDLDNGQYSCMLRAFKVIVYRQ